MLSIIIINYYGKEVLPGCLEALQRQTVKISSIIVVDNNSKDGSIESVKRDYPEVKVIELSENLGFARANNIALEQIQTKYVALLNNDAFVHSQWAAYLISALENNPDAGFAASKMLKDNNRRTIDRCGDGYSIAGAGVLRGRNHRLSCFRKKEWVFGACAGAALYRTAMLKEIGIFDEDFFLIYEDVDLSFRAQLMGYKCVYVPKAIVYHKGSSTLVHDSFISVYYGHRNLEWVYIKNMPTRLIVLTILPHVMYNIAAFFFFLINGQASVFLRAKMDAIAQVKKILKKRHEIQRKRRVDVLYIWRLFDKELFFPRLAMRINKHK